MMFDDSSVAGGHNSSMLNTSMKSEGGLSVLNTSRGEEVALFVTNLDYQQRRLSLVTLSGWWAV